MQSAPLPATELARLAALRHLDVLDSGPEAEFDALVKVASIVCQTPICLISLIDTERQWFKANIGLPGVSETPRDIAFCAHAILGDGVFEVPDASRDARFSDNPLVASQPDIRFYAGAPILMNDGHCVGTLCVIDREPRQLDSAQREILSNLAVAAAQALEGRRAIRANQEKDTNLRKSEALLKRTGTLAGVGGWEVDLMNQTIFWSDETCRIHGVVRGHTPKMEEALAFYAPSARPLMQAAVEVALSGGPGFDLELPLICADGAAIWVRSVGSVEFEDGKPRRLMGAFQDITARRAEQLALQEAQERVRLATESGGVGIWDLDLITGHLVWDAQTYRLYGLEPGDSTGAYDLWAGHLHPDDKVAAEQAFQISLATGQLFFNEFRVIWPDGSIHRLRGFGRVRYDGQGQAIRVVGTNIDVTEAFNDAQLLKAARDKAEEASQSKGQFLANMSHEIRTPMNAILGMLSLLQSTEMTARQLDYASKAEGAAKSLLGLINDILDFSKVEAGKMTLEDEPYRMDSLLRGLSVVLSTNVGAKNIEVLFDVDPALPEVVRGDALRLQQILVNLGANAVKFTTQGQVVISLQQKPSVNDQLCIEFSVQDSGIGIAPENQTHIFSGFSQAEASTTRRFGGTGLGLAICTRLVKLMGGDISLTSALGLGSTFSFTLTLPLVQDIPPELARPARTGQEPRQVLVVDDNPIAAALMLKMIQSWGWAVEVASHGAQALDMIHTKQLVCGKAFPYDVIYLDWQMPDMDGWETAREIRHISQQCDGPEPVLIMLSAHGRETLAQRSTQEQSLLNGFLAKPTTASMLFDAVMDAPNAHTGLRQVTQGRSNARQLTGMRILVVEDNLINQQVAEELLTSAGALVSLAANGQLGVEAVEAAAPQFDVVLMDIQMPVMDGYEATRDIRERLGLSTLPIVAMTANALKSDREACLAGGMNEHVGKPFDIAQLTSLLTRLTEFQSGALQTIDAASGEPILLEVVGLNLPEALARMSGMKGLYVRTARNFVTILSTVIVDLQHLLGTESRQKAVMLLHTLKGNAGTLGAGPLAIVVGRLETLCKTPEGIAGCLARLNALATLTESTAAALEQAIELLIQSSESAPPPPARPMDSFATLVALKELEALARAADLSVLQRYAETRASLQELNGEFCNQFDLALQDLNLTEAQTLCSAMVQKLLARIEHVQG